MFARPGALVAAVAVAVVAVGGTVAALAGGAGRGDGTRAADRRFAALMVPHHEAGIALDDAALRLTDDVRVRHLAFEMNSYQGRELDELRALAAGADGIATGVHDHGPLGLPTAVELADLERRRGPAFDRAFLTLMIRHHEGALVMAERDGLAGTGPEVRLMAHELVRVQTGQLARMRALLAELGGGADAAADGAAAAGAAPVSAPG